MASVRYLVDDVARSVSFYTENLDFKLEQQFGPAMAILSRGNLTLWLAGPMASASWPMPNGDLPKPGGWNRFVILVKDIETIVGKLKKNRVKFKNEILKGPGGSQILLEDPSGNVVELFQAATS